MRLPGTVWPGGLSPGYLFGHHTHTGSPHHCRPPHIIPLKNPCPVCRPARLHQQSLYVCCTVPKSCLHCLKRSRPSKLALYNCFCSYWISLGLFCILAFFHPFSSETPAQDTVQQPLPSPGHGGCSLLTATGLSLACPGLPFSTLQPDMPCTICPAHAQTPFFWLHEVVFQWTGAQSRLCV